MRSDEARGHHLLRLHHQAPRGQQRSYGEFAVNILAKQHPELDRLYIEAMAKQRDWSIEATDR